MRAATFDVHRRETKLVKSTKFGGKREVKLSRQQRIGDRRGVKRKKTPGEGLGEGQRFFPDQEAEGLQNPISSESGGEQACQ